MSKDAKFGDVNAMNEALRKDRDILGLYDGITTEDVVRIKGRKILWLCPDEWQYRGNPGCDPNNSHQEVVQTWEVISLKQFKIMAKFLVSGEIVFRNDIEGNDPDYYKLTPGKAEKVKPKF